MNENGDTFFGGLLVGVFVGGIIMGLTFVVFDDSSDNIRELGSSICLETFGDCYEFVGYDDRVVGCSSKDYKFNGGLRVVQVD